jgi:hypothetical protein
MRWAGDLRHCANVEFRKANCKRVIAPQIIQSMLRFLPGREVLATVIKKTAYVEKNAVTNATKAR